MSKKHTIKATEFLGDVRSGMADPELIEKYELTFSEFERLLRYLLDIGLVTEEQLEESQQLSKSQVIRAFVDSNEDSVAV